MLNRRGGVRTQLSKGRDVNVKSQTIKLTDAVRHLLQSKRGGAWPAFRQEIGKALNTGIPDGQAIIINAIIDGRPANEKEIASIETAMNSFLADLGGKYRLRYAEIVDKFVLADAAAVESATGGARRKRSKKQGVNV